MRPAHLSPGNRPRRPARPPHGAGPVRAHTRLAACALALAATGCTPGSTAPARHTAIHDVQGTGALSPLRGREVTVAGVVTGVRAVDRGAGFWLQDTAPDDDPRTSEGVFVHTGQRPTVAPGDRVEVTGTVSEYRPGGPDHGGLSHTELTRPRVQARGTAALPAPVDLGADALPAAYAADGDLEARPLAPAAYALDRYESWEGMRVRLRDARVVGPTAHREVWVTARPAERPTPRGGTHYGGYDQQNPGRVKVAPLTGPAPAADVGDRLAGETVGPLAYDQHGGYLVAATTVGAHRPGGLARETAAVPDPAELTVATYNVENLDPGDPPEKYTRLAADLVTHLRAPDIVALEEVQDDNGRVNDAVVGAAATYRRLVGAIRAAGGPAYEVRQIDPVDDADGGEPGGNIRVGFLFRPDRVSAADRPGGGPDTAVGVRADGGARLTHSPGRIAPRDPAFKDSRKPLAAEFSVRGTPVIVVACHLTSKGGDHPLTARTQPPARPSEAQRGAQTAVLRRFVDQVLGVQADARLVVLGDLNDFSFSPAVGALTAGGALRSLADTLPARERYTYVYQGNSQALDHTLVSRGWSAAAYDIVHRNAEFADQVSDHDPQVARLRP
ncbi:MAG TPA: endonuclease/exonuclease/phosphatase family protein [Pilimelia sp.]|nr:endonuclease/exonuclease/phosphatase family protein [Pilimelia sp.]